MAKELKTNAMRILDKLKIKYSINTYECDEFIDGVTIAKKLHQDPAMSFKTLVAIGKSGNYYVFAIPVDKELNLKVCAKTAGEKSVELIHVKDINKVTGYIRGGCTPLGMKKLYKTVIDSSALNFDEIIISGGRLGAQIIINPNDLANAVKGSFENIVMEN